MIQDNGVRSCTINRAVDGDTIETLTNLGDGVFKIQRHRLTIIDTPERGQAGAAAATEFTRQFVGTQAVLQNHGKDKYGRLLSDVYVIYEGQLVNLSSVLLEKGLAKVYGK